MKQLVQNMSGNCKWIATHERCCVGLKLTIAHSLLQRYGNEDEMHFTGSGWKYYRKIAKSEVRKTRELLTLLYPSINMSNMTI